MLRAIDQRDFYRAQMQKLKEQNNQKDFQIEKLTTEKQELKQNMLKLTQWLNNSESKQSKESTLKSNISDAMKKCSAKFSDSSILNDDLKLTFQILNDQMKSKLQIHNDWFNQSDQDKAEHVRVIYIKTWVDSKVTEHLYLWLKAQSEREIYIKKIIQCLKNVFKNSDQCLKTQKQLKKLKMSYLKNFNTFQSEFLRLMNSVKMSAD